jgi:hypothetical protein
VAGRADPGASDADRETLAQGHPPAQQAALVLAMLRKDERLMDLAIPNGISASTLRRWLLEVIGLLSGRAPRLNHMLRRLSACGQVVVLADGTP